MVTIATAGTITSTMCGSKINHSMVPIILTMLVLIPVQTECFLFKIKTDNQL